MRNSTPLVRMLGETLSVAELPRLALRLPELAARPRGRGQPVLVLPGFGGGDSSTGPIRSYLRFLGYRARGWGLGVNLGEVDRLLPRVVARTLRAAERARERVHLIGWSLGGALAREVACEEPDAVAQVITLGAPVIGAPRRAPPTPRRVPVTALYSRSDGVVDWRACIDPGHPDVEHVEVSTTHLGFGFSPEVYGIVADRLAAEG